MRIIWLILVFAGCLTLQARAQKPDTTRYRSRADSLAWKRDSANSVPFLERATRVKKGRKVEVPDSLHSPRTAVRRSLIFPGWGQIYNKHYIKTPIIIAALGVTGYYIISNHNEYTRFLAVARFQQTGRPLSEFVGDKHYEDFVAYGSRPAQAVIDFKDYWRRNRDLCILGFILGWGIQAVDAYVWAKFKHSYSMDNDLGRVHFSGGAMPTYASNNVSFVPSLKITIDL